MRLLKPAASGVGMSACRLETALPSQLGFALLLHGSKEETRYFLVLTIWIPARVALVIVVLDF